MAQEVLYPFSMPDSSVLFNKHFTDIFKPGVYTGLEVLARPTSRVLTVKAGCYLDKYGRNIVFKDDLLTAPIADSAMDKDRIDAICIYCPGQPVNGVTQDPVITIKKGTPAQNPAGPIIDPAQDYFPIALVRVRHNDAYVYQSDIQMINRPMEASEYNKSITEGALLMIHGNRKVSGLTLSFADSKINVGYGSCLIGGRFQTSMDGVSLQVPDVNAILADVQSTNISTIVASFQPTLPVKIKIYVTLAAETSTGSVFISGTDENGQVITDTAAMIWTESTPLVRCLVSTKYFSSISAISLANFDPAINKTAVQVRAVNTFYVVATRHDHYNYLPIRITSVAPVQPSVDEMILGTFQITYNGVNRSVTLLSGHSSANPGLARVYRIPGTFHFAGSLGDTLIDHNLGLSPNAYTAIVRPVPANAGDAAKIGMIWFEYFENSVRVRNAGSSECPFTISLLLEE